MRRALRAGRLLPPLLAGVALALSLACLERLPLQGAARRRQRCTQWVLKRMGAALPYEVRVIGALPTVPMLWVSNHVSWADVPVLGGLAPLAFLAKEEVRRWPLLGWLAARGGTLFIRRGASESASTRRAMAGHLGQNGPVLVFPEGTTTDGRGTSTFHARLLGAAIEAGVPLQPVALRYLRNGAADPLAPFIGDDDLLSHLRRLLHSPKGQVEVHLLAPIPSTGQDRTGLAKAAQAAINAVLTPTPALPAAPQTPATVDKTLGSLPSAAGTARAARA